MDINNLFTVSDISPDRAARIFARINFDKATGCWLWTGCANVDGYGYVSYRQKTVYIHRFMYAWLIQPIPKGRGKDIPVLDHICNNRACCNPAHLILVLPRENVARTNAPPAINARKTLCKRGHELSAPHPITGRRRCYKCDKIRRRIRAYKASQA